MIRTAISILQTLFGVYRFCGCVFDSSGELCKKRTTDVVNDLLPSVCFSLFLSYLSASISFCVWYNAIWFKRLIYERDPHENHTNKPSSALERMKKMR